MTRGTLRHNAAAVGCAAALKHPLRGRPCRMFAGDVKVAVAQTDHCFHPDVVVTCSAADLKDMGAVAIAEPTLVLEVLSPSTAAYDRGQKFLSLQKLPSLQEYALLDAEAPRLEVYRRNAAGRLELYVVEGPEATAELASVGWQGPLAALLD